MLFQHSQSFHFVALTDWRDHMEEILLTLRLKSQSFLIIFINFNYSLEHDSEQSLVIKQFCESLAIFDFKPNKQSNTSKNWPEHIVDFISFQLFNQKP